MTERLQKPGLYGRLKGVEYVLQSRGAGWILVTDHPAPGFEELGSAKNASRRYAHTIAPGEKIDTYRLSYAGSYRGLELELVPAGPGQVMAISKDPRSREHGFDSFDRDQWMTHIALDDRALRVTANRTPVPAPWLRSDPGGRR